MSAPLETDSLRRSYGRQRLGLVALAHGAAGDGVGERITALLARLGLPARGAFLP